ncbi:hypothetical protein D3C73_1423710 [compost metagenome]
MQGVGHDDDRLDNLHVLAGLGDVLDERAIDLQRVQGQASQVCQGRVTGAEVVDRQRNTNCANLPH